MAILDSDPPQSVLAEMDVEDPRSERRNTRRRILIEDIVAKRIVPELLARRREEPNRIAKDDTVVSLMQLIKRGS